MIKNKFFIKYLLSDHLYFKPETFLQIGFWLVVCGFHLMNYYYNFGGNNWNVALSMTALNLFDIPITLIYFHLCIPMMLYAMRYKLSAPLPLLFGYVFAILGLAWIDGFLFSEIGNRLKNIYTDLDLALNHKNLTWQYNFPETIFTMFSYEAVMFLQKVTKDKNRLELLQDNMKKNYENLHLKYALEENEVQQLRFLIDRHTLLNMMDSIYFSKDLDAAQDLALKIKALMSYALSDSIRHKVLLTNEIDILKDYIDLKKLEFSHRNISIELKVIGVVEEQWTIAPFLLFVFVENVFKHGIHKVGNEGWAKIRLEMKGSQLHFHTWNKDTKENVGDSPNTMGKGIRLTRRRLKTLYPEKHILDLKSSHNVFEVYLMMDLAENQNVPPDSFDNL